MSFFHHTLNPLRSKILSLRDRHLHTITLSPDKNGAVVFGNPDFRHHLARVYLNTDENLKTLWRFHPTDSRHALQHCIKTFGLAVGPKGLLPDGPAFPAIMVPQYVRPVIDLPENSADFWNGLSASLTRQLRKLQSSDFEFRLTRDPAALETFRTGYLNPTILARHRAEKFLTTQSHFLKTVQNPNYHLIQLLRQGQWVSGCICCEEESTYRLTLLGWKNGDPQILKSGAVPALYQKIVTQAYGLGKKRVALGATLPYLEDGVLTFKAKWKAHLDASSKENQVIAWHFDPSHPQFRRFLERHSLIAYGCNGRWVVYSAQAPKTGKTYRKLLRSISVWYRLRDQPSSSSQTTHPDVPAALRPWFEPVLPLPNP
jgi:hypothetical protein